MSLAVAGTGVIRMKTIMLFTPEERDQAMKKPVHYEPPGWMLLLILNLKFDNQAGQIWARLASVKVRHALRFRKRVAIRILAPKIAVITRKTMYTENLG